MRLHVLLRGAVLAAVGSLVASAGNAAAAQAPFMVPSGGVERTVSFAHMTFSLPASFGPARSALTGRALAGTYVQPLAPPAPQGCSLQIAASSRVQTAHPHEGEWENGTFAVKERGRTGAVHWSLGRSRETLVAVGWRRAPKGLAPPRYRYLRFSARLDPLFGGSPANRACGETQPGWRRILRTAIRTARVTRR
jgi:hypothetical protein